MRLIDADELLRLSHRFHISEFDRDGVEIIYADTVRNAPTVETQKTGRWIENKHCIGHACSICGKMAPETFHVDAFTLERIYEEVLTEFCPHCGADMRGGEDN